MENMSEKEISKMSQLTNYPNQIINPRNSLDKSNSESEKWESLLNLGESLLQYLVGFLFGEYKRSGKVSEKIETIIYSLSKGNLSLGHYRLLLENLSKEVEGSVFLDKFEKSKEYPNVSECVFNYNLLKELINEGADGDFDDEMEKLRKSRSPSKVDLAGQNGFFSAFVNMRNNARHPELKAGPSKDWKEDNKKLKKDDQNEYNSRMKSVQRNWPLNEDYFTLINPFLKMALDELIIDFNILKDYHPILTKSLDDKDSSKGIVLREIDGKEEEEELVINSKELDLKMDTRYLIDSKNNLFIKLYIGSLPQLNPSEAKKIIDQENAKAGKPIMKTMIKKNLEDDGKIDDTELFALQNTAEIYSIDLKSLFKLIGDVARENEIKHSIGTPEEKGDIFIENKESQAKLPFNPWWMRYFLMVPKINKQTITEEKAKKKKLEDVINKKKKKYDEDLKKKKTSFKQKIKKLKDSKKNLPATKRLKTAEKNLKNKRAQQRKQIKSIKVQIQKKRAVHQKAKDPERKNELKSDIEEMKLKEIGKREDFDKQIAVLVEMVERMEAEKVEKINDLDNQINKWEDELNNLGRDDSTNNIENELSKLKVELREYDDSTQWGIHKDLWNEISQYVDNMLDIHLNEDGSDLDDAKDDDEFIRPWVNTPNAWQIGSLTHTYWARIHEVNSPLGKIYNVGYAISRDFPWLPNQKGIHPELLNTFKKPVSLMWTTQDDDWAAIIDPERILANKKDKLDKELISKYETELIKLGVNIRCKPKSGPVDGKNDEFLPLEEFLKKPDRYTAYQGWALYSRIWSVDKFIVDGRIDLNQIYKYEKEMSTLLKIFTNVVTQLNEFAMLNGFNEESINERKEKNYLQYRELMFKEFEKDFPGGTLFRPSGDQEKNWLEMAKEQYGISETLYKLMSSRFRFQSGYIIKKELKIKRDQHSPGSKQYIKYDKKLKEL